MKRYIYLIVITSLFNVFLLGCQLKSDFSPNSFNEKQNILKYKKSIRKEENKKINFAIKQSSSSYPVNIENIIFYFYNNSDMEIVYGCGNIELDVKIGDDWYLILGKFGPEASYIIPANSYTIENVYFKDWRNYTFSPGHYRLVFTQNGKWSASEFNLK